MHKSVIDLFRHVKEWYTHTYQELTKVKDMLQAAKTPEEATDIAYAMREMHKWCDDIRKEMMRLKEVGDRIACLYWVMNPTDESIRTDYCTAVPKIQQQAKVPKLHTDPDAYFALMDFLKVPHAVAKAEIVRPYWPAVVELLSTMAEEGRPLPPGIDPNGARPIYCLSIRGKRSIDEE